jgi:DNA uptake protein ComE-like DNA-binding protein
LVCLPSIRAEKTTGEQEYDAFLRDKTRLAAVRDQMGGGAATDAQLKVNLSPHTAMQKLRIVM